MWSNSNDWTVPARRILGAWLVLALVTGLTLGGVGQALAATPTDTLNSARRHIACEGLSEAARRYYGTHDSYEFLSSLPGTNDAADSRDAMQDNQLFDALHALMRSTLAQVPTYGGFGPGSLAWHWNRTDTSPDVDNSKESHFLMFYSDAPYEYPGTMLKMNREHVWPKSRASYYEQNGGSDLHHLRPSIDWVNDAKSDNVFGFVDEVYPEGYDTVGVQGQEVAKAYPGKDLFEPKDDVKGDIARILLYVYCCWEQPNLYSDVEPDLLPAPDADDRTNTGGRVIADLDTLLDWCEFDPVDTWEMQRNDLTEAVQGNRNVFIDYPELAWPLFGRSVPEGMQTPTHAGCDHEWGEQVVETESCVRRGTSSRMCRKCGNVRSLPTPAPGHVDMDANLVCDRCGWPVLQTHHLATQISGGEHLILYHPASATTLAPRTTAKRQLAPMDAINTDDDIVASMDSVVLYVEPAGGAGFHLRSEGGYLTCSSRGGDLFFAETPDECSVWTITKVGDRTYNILNARASSFGKPQGIEHFKRAFTTYGTSEEGASLFALELYTSKEHAYREVSKTEPTCTEPGTRHLACKACGAEEDVEIPAMGHDWGDWVMTREASETREGEEQRRCLNDPSHIERRAIPARPAPAPKGDADRTVVMATWPGTAHHAHATSTATTTATTSPTTIEGTGHVRRIAGTTRYATMASVCAATCAASEWVVIASGDTYPDALCAAPLAGAHDAPIVLTEAGTLSPEAAGQLERLRPTHAIIVGGEAAVSAAAEGQVRAMVADVVRVAGTGRAQTSAATLAATRAADASSATVIVACGHAFADALSAGAYAWATSSPIALTDADGTLSAGLVEAIRSDTGLRRVLIVGGTSAVADDVMTQLGDGLEFVRVGGADRYETSALLADWACANGLSWTRPVVATGRGFADALAGSALAGTHRSPLVLTDSASDETMASLRTHRDTIAGVFVLGGTAAFPDEILNAVKDAID